MCIFWLKAKVVKALEFGTACHCALALFSFGVSRSLSITRTTIFRTLEHTTLLAVQRRDQPSPLTSTTSSKPRRVFPLYNLGTGTAAAAPLQRRHWSESTDHIGARKQQQAYLQTLRDSIALLEYHRSIALWSFCSESLIGVPYYTTAHTQPSRRTSRLHNLEFTEEKHHNLGAAPGS